MGGAGLVPGGVFVCGVVRADERQDLAQLVIVVFALAIRRHQLQRPNFQRSLRWRRRHGAAFEHARERQMRRLAQDQLPRLQNRPYRRDEDEDTRN
jgi:hypothetical protein